MSGEVGTGIMRAMKSSGSRPPNSNRRWRDALLRLFGRNRAHDTDSRMPRPFIRRTWRHVTLQFSDTDAQSRMLRRQPEALLVDYTRTMLGALLLNPAPRRMLMIGLGGGSQAKFCHRHCPELQIEVVEISADVIALRRRFRIPPDDDRFRVVHGDGAVVVGERRGQIDLLLVDGYDAHGIAPALSTQGFYDDCRAALGADGVVAFNLYCLDPDSHIERIRQAFGTDRMLVVREPRMSNRVVFGWNGRLSRATLQRLQARIPDWLDRDARTQLAGAFAEVAAAARQRFG